MKTDRIQIRDNDFSDIVTQVNGNRNFKMSGSGIFYTRMIENLDITGNTFRDIDKPIIKSGLNLPKATYHINIDDNQVINLRSVGMDGERYKAVVPCLFWSTADSTVVKGTTIGKGNRCD